MEARSLLLNGSHLHQVVLSNPSFPLLGNPADLPDQAPSVLLIDPRIRAPYALQATLGLERKVSRDTSFSAEYMMLRGFRQYRQRDVNAPLSLTGQRPDPSFLNVDQFETSGSSHFHSLTLKSQTTVFRGRLQFHSQYTFSHSIDDTSGMLFLPANNLDLRSERGRSDFDQRHRFTFAGVFNMPRNFSLGCIATAYSGIPYDITTGFDDNSDTVVNDRPSVGSPYAPWNSVGVDGSLVGGTRGILYDGAQALLRGPLVPVNGRNWIALSLLAPGSRTNSAAISAYRSLRPSAQRYSMATVRPSIQPSSRSRCTKAAVHWLQFAEVAAPSKPMVGSLACCARAASGHAAAAPPNSVMNSRRFMCGWPPPGKR